MLHAPSKHNNCIRLLQNSNIFRAGTLFTIIKRTTPRAVQDWDLTNFAHIKTYVILIGERDHLEDPGVDGRII